MDKVEKHYREIVTVTYWLTVVKFGHTGLKQKHRLEVKLKCVCRKNIYLYPDVKSQVRLTH